MHPSTPEPWLTTAQAAPLYGMTPAQLRRAAAAGVIAGATPLGAPGTPWRFDPAHVPGATKQPPTVTGEGLLRPHNDRATGRARADITSTPCTSDTLPRTLEVVEHLHAVTSRPAVALAGVLQVLTHADARHYAGRDGWCVACSWQYPCPDARSHAAALDLAHRVVLEGARA